jgi:tRNA-modifying protein YgfZ
LRAKVTVDAPAVTLVGRRIATAATWQGQALPEQAMDCLAAVDCCALRIDAGRVLFAFAPGTAASLAADIPGLPADDAYWFLADIRAGFARPGAAASTAFIPQMLNLDLVDAVSFSKGCYPGQEIVTRTRHLGRVKRRLFRYGCATRPMLVAGEPLFGPAGECGTVVSAATTDGGGEMLAVVRLDAARGPLFADAGRTRPVQALPLPYPVPEAPPA